MDSNLLIAFVTSKINLNPERWDLIIKTYGSLDVAVSDNFAQIKAKWLEKWPKEMDLETEMKKFQLNLKNREIAIITHLDKAYPEKLKALTNYPMVLYFQGNLELLENTQMLTVVGSRNYTKYAQIILEKILKPACRLGIGVVSGLALGIDGISHQIALESKAPTIAVIGSGLDDESFYPRENLGLKKQLILNGNLILSEYPPGTTATVYTFPQRNRILAALSELTWVVQASKKSGSLITASQAQDLGKTIATTPGAIFEESLSGNIQLLKDGASLIIEPEDILQLLGLSRQIKTVVLDIQFDSEIEEKVYKQLSLSPQNIENISQNLKINLTELSGVLSMLELSGIATNIGQNQWIRGS